MHQIASKISKVPSGHICLQIPQGRTPAMSVLPVYHPHPTPPPPLPKSWDIYGESLASKMARPTELNIIFSSVARPIGINDYDVYMARLDYG